MKSQMDVNHQPDSSSRLDPNADTGPSSSKEVQEVAGHSTRRVLAGPQMDRTGSFRPQPGVGATNRYCSPDRLFISARARRRTDDRTEGPTEGWNDRVEDGADLRT